MDKDDSQVLEVISEALLAIGVELGNIRRILESGSVPVQNGPRTAGSVTGGSSWLCPVHRVSKVIPAGVSKRTGNPYDAFVACGTQGCTERPPRPPRPVAAAAPAPAPSSDPF